MRKVKLSYYNSEMLLLQYDNRQDSPELTNLMYEIRIHVNSCNPKSYIELNLSETACSLFRHWAERVIFSLRICRQSGDINEQYSAQRIDKMLALIKQVVSFPMWGGFRSALNYLETKTETKISTNGRKVSMFYQGQNYSWELSTGVQTREDVYCQILKVICK